MLSYDPDARLVRVHLQFGSLNSWKAVPDFPRKVWLWFHSASSVSSARILSKLMHPSYRKGCLKSSYQTVKLEGLIGAKGTHIRYKAKNLVYL